MIVYTATPPDVAVRRDGRRHRVPGLPGGGREGGSPASTSPTRTRRSRSSRCATTRISTRRCASSRATRPATPRARTSTSTSSRSPSRRAASSSTTSRSSTRSCRRFSRARPKSSRPASRSTKFLAINGELRQEEQREDRVVRQADLAGDPVGRRRLPPLHQQRRRVGLRRPPHLRLQGQGGGPAGAPRLRPRVVHRTRRSSRPIAARCCSPTSWASTATASSSITGWACSRSTRTCRRSTSRRATRSRRSRQIGRSGMTGLAGGDHLHFTMLVNGQHGEPGRVVGRALDPGPDPSQTPLSVIIN